MERAVLIKALDIVAGKESTAKTDPYQWDKQRIHGAAGRDVISSLSSMKISEVSGKNRSLYPQPARQRLTSLSRT